VRVHKRKKQGVLTEETVCGEDGYCEYQWRLVTCTTCLKKAPAQPKCRWAQISKTGR